MKNHTGVEKLLKLEDMRKLEFISYPAYSHSRNKIAYMKSTTDINTGDYIHHVYEIDMNMKTIESVHNNEEFIELNPAFSPDGKKLAYLSTQSGSKQIWIKDYENSKKISQLTTMRYGIDSFTWSPDSSSIIFVTYAWDDEKDIDLFSEMTSQEKQNWENGKNNSPIEIDELMYKLDESYGIVDGSCTQIGLVIVDSKKACILTSGKISYCEPSWTPDGKSIAFYGRPYNHKDAYSFELYMVSIADKKINQITKDNPFYSPYPVVFSMDGEYIIYAGRYKEKNGITTPKLFKMRLNGEERECILPEQEICHGLYPMSIGITLYDKGRLPYKLSQCGGYIYFISGWNGNTHLYRVNISGEHLIERITNGSLTVNSFCSPEENLLIYIKGDTTSLAEVYCYDLLSKNETKLTNSNSWMENIIIQAPEEMWVKTKDGTDIHGWVIKPATVEVGKKYPAVLDIHGGPTTYYSAGWNFEFQMLSAAGYTVVYCDPRGSSGYGCEFVKDEYAWGITAYNDLMEYLNKAIEKYDFIDSNRLGVTGGSYGGWMTNKIIGYTNKFKAAVTQRTFSNPSTSYGTGDMGFVSAVAKKPDSFLDYMLERVRNGTITSIDRMNTPLLILHGEKDYRCSLEQGEQIFAVMKDRHPNIPVRMAIFPGENHGVTRTGKMHNQIGHLGEMLEWFDKFINQNGMYENCEKISRLKEIFNENKPYWVFENFEYRKKEENKCIKYTIINDKVKKEEISITTLDGFGNIKYSVVMPYKFVAEKEYPTLLYLGENLLNSCDENYCLDYKNISSEGIGIISVKVRENKEYIDLLQIIDEATKKYKWIDKARLGIFGIGKGAHEAVWILGHSKIFKTSIVCDGTYNNLIMYASSSKSESITSKFYENFTDFMLEQIKNSPVSYTDNVDIPVLVLHNIKNNKYPVEEAHQLFVALKDQHKNVPVKMVLYPNHIHNFEKNYYNQIISWLKAYL